MTFNPTLARLGLVAGALMFLGFGLHIPLPELPDRLDELDRDRPVVTLCPHYDRAEIARLYLKLQGFDARYCLEGLLGIVEYLRGDRARDLLQPITSTAGLDG